MNLKENPADFRPNESVFRWTSYLLIAAMIACGALTVGSFIHRMMASWQPWLMAAICFFVALDGLFIHHRMKNESTLSPGWLAIVVVQATVIFLLVKLVLSLSNGLQAFLAELSMWSRGILGNFITFDLLIAFAMAMIAWLLSGHFGELIDKMSIEQALIDQTIEVPDQRAGPQARDHMMSLIFTILIFLVMSTALVRVDLEGIANGNFMSLFFRLPPLAGGGGSTLAFFMLGLALLSQTQFISMHTSWSIAHVPVSGRLAGRWAIYSILFLIILAGVASLLPTRYSMRSLSALSYLINVVSQFFFIILQVVFTLLAFLISLPYLLFGKQPPVQNRPVPTPEITPPLQGTTPGTIPWLDMVRSIVFWILLLAVSFYALRQYLRQHQEVLTGLRRIPGWRYISRFWAWLKSMRDKLGAGIAQVVERERQRLEAFSRKRQATASAGFFNLRHLNPRQRVYFYYLSLVRRGSEQVAPRQPSQTPSEYAQILDHELPAAGNDIDQLTGAFIEARYSRHDVKAEDANSVMKTWGRIRGALRGKKKTPPG